jgi:hypothetical protein
MGNLNPQRRLFYHLIGQPDYTHLYIISKCLYILLIQNGKASLFIKIGKILKWNKII